MELDGKKVLVIGAARSGVAASQFLVERGATVALNDRKPLEEWGNEALELKSKNVALLPGDVPMWLLDQIKLVVLSPGVPTNLIPVRYAERAGAEVIGEVELAARFMRGKIVAITGSNGKTTTTTLVGELLRNANFHVQVGGNIGTPLVSLVHSSRDHGWTVAEISSFQLETTKEFHPHVATVLNVTPDHMDRYEHFTDYAAAKHRIFRNQTNADTAVLNADDETTRSWADGLRAQTVCFSLRRELDRGVFLRSGNEIVLRDGGAEQVLMQRNEIPLPGLHNVENVMAAFAVVIACGAHFDSMRETVKNFRAVEHRLEFAAEVGGIRFYNDSKATNVDAALKALEAFADTKGRIVLILGGRGKGASYAPLAPHLRARGRALILIGEDADRIESELGNDAAVVRAADMGDAVRRAHAATQTGDIVLLAPACASFDMFTSYEHRGREFKKAVKEMMNGRSQESEARMRAILF